MADFLQNGLRNGGVPAGSNFGTQAFFHVRGQMQVDGPGAAEPTAKTIQP